MAASSLTRPTMQRKMNIMLNCLCVGLGGFVGSVLRYLVGLIPWKTASGFPFKTLIINVVGAFLIGLFSALAQRNSAFDPKLVLFLKVGLCGGFTTFSTFAYEIGDLFTAGQVLPAVLYAMISVGAGVLAVFLGQLGIR